MQCRTIWPPVVDSESRAQSQNEWIEVLCLCFGIVYGIPPDQNIKVFDPSHYTVSQLRQGYYCIQSIPCVRKVLLGLSLFMYLHPLLPTQTIRDSFYGHTIYIIIYSNRFFLLTQSLCKVRESAKKSKRFQINFTQMFRARSATTFCGSSAFFMVTHSRDFIFIFTIIYAKFFSAQCFCFKSPKESWLFKVVQS